MSIALPEPKTDPMSEQLRRRCATLHVRHERMKEAYEELPAAMREDLHSRMERIETMLKALDRDIDELSLDHGADRAQVAQLEDVIDSELAKFDHEIETLSLGSPSTLTAALDKLLDTLERVGERFRR